MDVRNLLNLMWDDYRRLNPQAGRIHALLELRGEKVINDHIALRTFADSRVNIDRMSEPFVSGGYREAGRYDFPEKKLTARHYEHKDPLLPKVFISELRLHEISGRAQQLIKGLLDQLPGSVRTEESWPMIGRPWKISTADYEFLAGESEYAGWMGAWGFRANHFTVLVNALKTIGSLEELNNLLVTHGFSLNASGGKIKGTPGQLLEQSSTLAEKVRVEFVDGVREIPGCYYEFARRYPAADGALFQGFVPQSANKIFESTDRR
jgi:hypothetical protein